MGTNYYLICQFHREAIDIDKAFAAAGNPYTGESYTEVDWRMLLRNAKTPVLSKIQEFLEDHDGCRLLIADDENEPWAIHDLNEKGWQVWEWEDGDKFILTTDENREEYWDNVISK